jgi:hypothetical protein
MSVYSLRLETEKVETLRALARKISHQMGLDVRWTDLARLAVDKMLNEVEEGRDDANRVA